MVTQKSISLKIDTSVLERLDEEVKGTWKSRNKIINLAIETYLDLLEVQRRQRLDESQGHKVSKEALQFIKLHIIHNVQYYLDRIDY